MLPSGLAVCIARMPKGLSLNKSLSVHGAKADITTQAVTFTDKKTYTRKPTIATEAIKDTVDYAAVSGPDAAGAKAVNLAGGFHKSPPTRRGPDRWEHVTGTVLDAHGHRLYFHRRSDGTFWNRIHFPRKHTRDPQNAAVWAKKNDFIRITKEQFTKKAL